MEINFLNETKYEGSTEKFYLVFVKKLWIDLSESLFVADDFLKQYFLQIKP